MRRAAASVVAAVALAGCGGGGQPGSSLSENAQVFVLPRAGGEPRRLTADDRDHVALSWAPGGGRLASLFDSGIAVLTPGGQRLTTFRGASANTDALAWSPDGRKIAFETEYDNPGSGAISARLMTVALRRGARRTLAPRATGRPSWAPDGRSLVYVRGDVVEETPGDCTPPPDRPPDPSCQPSPGSPPEEVWRVRADGGKARRLVSNASSQFPAQLSRDGKRLVFARTAPDDDAAVAVWVARGDGTHQKRLARGLIVPEVAWAPDDRGVAVVAAGRSRAYAFVLSPSGRRRKLPRAIATGSMAWSPDGGLIAWANGPRIEAIRPDGRGHRVLTRLAAGIEVGALSWSRDGRRLAFTAAKPPPED